jgi:hypothetical protein
MLPLLLCGAGGAYADADSGACNTASLALAETAMIVRKTDQSFDITRPIEFCTVNGHVASTEQVVPGQNKQYLSLHNRQPRSVQFSSASSPDITLTLELKTADHCRPTNKQCYIVWLFAAACCTLCH